jgi:hypothetical protein
VSNLEFTLEGALSARCLIEDSYNQAVFAFKDSVKQGNAKRKQYWLERITHLMNEVNWIDTKIKEIEADAL